MSDDRAPSILPQTVLGAALILFGMFAPSFSRHLMHLTDFGFPGMLLVLAAGVALYFAWTSAGRQLLQAGWVAMGLGLVELGSQWIEYHQVKTGIRWDRWAEMRSESALPPSQFLTWPPLSVLVLWGIILGGVSLIVRAGMDATAGPQSWALPRRGRSKEVS